MWGGERRGRRRCRRNVLQEGGVSYTSARALESAFSPTPSRPRLASALPGPRASRASCPPRPQDGASVLRSPAPGRRERATEFRGAPGRERVLGSADAQLSGAGGPGTPALRSLGLLEIGRAHV